MNNRQSSYFIYGYLEASATAADPSLFLLSSWCNVSESVIRFHFSREMVFQRCRCDFSLTDHVLSIPHYLTNNTNEFIFWGWFFVRMSNENELVFRSDIIIDNCFWLAHFCLVDVFRFHVPHSSVGKRAFSMFTTLTILCIRAVFFLRMFS